MSDKCSHHKDKRKRLIGRIFKCVLLTLFIGLVVFLLIWVILQPQKPKFKLQDATVFLINASFPNVVTTKFQITVIARNPNNKVGIYYDRLEAYAVYHDQRITLSTLVYSVYQGHKENNVWSPFLEGTEVPVARYNGIALQQDQLNGQVQLMIKIDGRVRFKVGTYTSGHYRLHVKCPALITFGSPSTGRGVIVGDSMKYTLAQSCSVSL